jgi:hypothetical protein
MTFMKQHVDLNIQRLRDLGHNPERSEPPQSIRPMSSVAMHVNRESRQEGARHYIIMLPGSSRAVCATASILPFSVNFSTDSCSLSLKQIGTEKHQSEYKE